MIERKIGALILLFCFCFCLLPIAAQAASERVRPIIPENRCRLTIIYSYEDAAFSEAEVKLYRIAEVSEDYKYTLTPAFETYRLALNGIQTTGEWNVIRTTLETHIIASGIEPDAVSKTDENGQVCFENLKTGLYLAVIGQVSQGTLRYRFDSALVALPGTGQDGNWQYEVSVKAKGELLPPAEPEKVTELKVLKLWKGDEGKETRPNQVEIEIFRNGVSYEKVVLSEENHWSYSWQAKDDGAGWAVVERNVPQGYVMTVAVRETSFVATNTWIPLQPEDPVDPPKTGDTTNVMLYILLMMASGTMLMILGITRKRTGI